MVNTITNNNLSAAANDNFAVIDFSATWCGPCKMLAPVYHELADENDGSTKFYSVDVDENASLARRFGIYSVPTLVVMKNGKEVARNSGFQPKNNLAAWIDSYK